MGSSLVQYSIERELMFNFMFCGVLLAMGKNISEKDYWIPFVYVYKIISWLYVLSRRSEVAESGVVRLGGRGEG